MDETGEAFSLPLGDGRLAEERLNEKRRENLRSPVGGDVTPRPQVDDSIVLVLPSVDDLSSSRLRLRDPRNLSLKDLPVNKALRVAVLLFV